MSFMRSIRTIDKENLKKHNKKLFVISVISSFFLYDLTEILVLDLYPVSVYTPTYSGISLCLSC